MRRRWWAALALPVLLVAGALALPWLDPVQPLVEGSAESIESTASTASATEPLERGRVLALAGNCTGCHTARGGAPYAGGRAIATPFGTAFAGNLTPDPATGLGRWTPAQFWRAMHHGQGADGRRLLPVFPYTETTRLTRADSDALFAWLRTLPPVAQPARAHALRWPYGTQTALAAWRLLFFRPGVWQDQPAQSAAWNRGAYLVNGVAHCVACHGGRNALGATADAGFGGGLMPTRNGYAPALNRADQAGVADWPLDDIVALLRDGHAPRGDATGPMAEVVSGSTQHLPAADLHAIAVYLKALPPQPVPAPAAAAAVDAGRFAAGGQIYADHCASCHGELGEGGVLADGRRVVPALAGNRMVTMDPPTNLVRAIVFGGFGAATAARPRPFGMPPYAHLLSDEQIGAVASYLRASWGAQAPALSAFDVARWRGGRED